MFSRRHAMRGFTLLEVLVALAIVSIALGASLRAVGSLTGNHAGLRIATLAAWSAQNSQVQLRLSKVFPGPGMRRADCSQAEVELSCVETVIATPNPRLRRVEVSVYASEQPQRRVFKLVQLVASP
jgi:general secretion pathway protein I